MREDQQNPPNLAASRARAAPRTPLSAAPMRASHRSGCIFPARVRAPPTTFLVHSASVSPHGTLPAPVVLMSSWRALARKQGAGEIFGVARQTSSTLPARSTSLRSTRGKHLFFGPPKNKCVLVLPGSLSSRSRAAAWQLRRGPGTTATKRSEGRDGGRSPRSASWA